MELSVDESERLSRLYYDSGQIKGKNVIWASGITAHHNVLIGTSEISSWQPGSGHSPSGIMDRAISLACDIGSGYSDCGL